MESLRRLGARFHLGGSLASSAHGLVRSAFDADLAASLGGLSPEQQGVLVGELRGAYLVEESHLLRAIRRRGSFSLIHLETLLKVDVFVVRDRPFDRRVGERLQDAEIPFGDGTLAVPLVSAEDLVLLKLEWFRNGGEVTTRHWDDAVGVLLVQHGRVDTAYLERGAAELGVGDLLDRARKSAAGLM